MRNISALLTFTALAGGTTLWGACSSNAARQCNVGADCASGACNADGTCVATPAGDGGNSEASVGVTDGGSQGDAHFVEDAAPPACASGGDSGVLDHDAIPLAAGLTATFRIATNETIDTTGTLNADGSRSWDFSGALASDKDQIVTTLSPAGTWWTGSFATATYATTLSSTATTLGVFDYSANALLLLGVVSPTSDNVTETKLTYATPIPILNFPLHNGQTWSTTSNVSGTLSGISSFYSETYDSVVDAYGTVKTPFATFNALRIGTLLTQASVNKTRTYAWVTACYGTIAKATSATTSTGTAPAENFSQAAELERLTP